MSHSLPILASRPPSRPPSKRAAKEARLGHLVGALAVVTCLGAACTSGSSLSGSGGGGPSASGGGGFGGGGPAVGGSTPDRPTTPGTAVTVTPPASRTGELGTVTAAIAATSTLDAAGLLAAHALPFVSSTSLGYDPSSATNLPLVQASALALSASEMDLLTRQGFVLSERQVFPGFLYGYATIYSQDLPVFVSADSILYAVHRSYDQILKALELDILVGELHAMLTGMRTRLGAGASAPFGPAPVADADLYLAVALGLLDGQPAAPVAGASTAQIANLLSMATAASGTADVTLFGSQRTLDFSQFTPRGHYLGTPALEQYFRAMIWLGRTDLPLVDVSPSGGVLFHRPAFEAAVALTNLLDAPTLAHWKHLDDSLRAFVGEPDGMEPPDLPRLVQDLGAVDLGALAALPDQQLAAGIVAGGYGQQRIASQILDGAAQGTDTSVPLASTFLLLGQRYVVDSHVFSNVVYDRVNHRGFPSRMMPDPLDVAYAALGNDAAAPLLQAGLVTYGYAPDLERARTLVDLHGDDFWSANLYNLWLSALRALSPTAAGLTAPTTIAVPAIFRSEPWARRTLNTQLASWAELRHDTILYAKQSYTSGAICVFPDAFVEPNLAFFDRIGAYARQGAALVQSLDFSTAPTLGMDIGTYFAHLADVAGILGAMADAQQTGAALAPAYLDFINQAVKRSGVQVCGGPPAYDGWYTGLFYPTGFQGQAGFTAETFDPTIADVHTEPTDETGAPVGNVLHVGTGFARLMVLTVESCGGPRAYAGLASSYHEVTTTGFKRLTDDDWATQVNVHGAGVTNPVWVQPILSQP